MMNNLRKIKRNRKGISPIIGYVLLISVAIAMSIIVYQWIKTYVPTEDVECPDGLSLMITDTDYNLETETLEIGFKNNGLFNIDGYFISGSDSPEKEVATIDLSGYNSEGATGRMANFYSTGKKLEPGETVTNEYSGIPRVYKIQITPARQEEIDGKLRMASCSNARIEEDL